MLHKDRLVAAGGLVSHVGPFFSDHFDRLAERTISAAHNFRLAYAEGAFGTRSRPLTGWLMVVDTLGSHTPVSDTSRHFPVSPEFERVSLQQRYRQLCQRLMRERLNSTACVITSPKSALASGQHADFGDVTDLRSFVAALAWPAAPVGGVSAL